ncbi:MAG: GTP pyrophosphokinase family protein [Acetatifactor sp.]
MEQNTPAPTRDFDRLVGELTDADSIATIESIFAAWQEMMSRYRCAIMEVETKFRVLNDQFSLQHERNPIENIKTRIKSPDSIRRKMAKKGLTPPTLSAVEENLNDVAGIRVICSFIDDIYMLADCLTGQDDITLIECKDYIKHPKENGYRSLHLIVEVPIFLQNEKRNMKVEVQLRTIAMEFWANLEHRLRYKKDLPETVQQATADELYQCAEISAQLDRRMQQVRYTVEK